MAKKTSKEEYKKILAKLNYARSILYMYSMVTDKENDNIHKRISKFQDKHKISITREELDSVRIITEEIELYK